MLKNTKQMGRYLQAFAYKTVKTRSVMITKVATINAEHHMNVCAIFDSSL